MKDSEKAKLIERIRSAAGLDDDDRATLIGMINERRSYGMVWEMQPEDAEERLRRHQPVLIEEPELAIKSDAPDAPRHMIIEGENLESLSALTFTHAGKIDIIYIDPPYNTGNKDFRYNDDYVDPDNDYRHSKWLSFMKRRLSLAKRLLSDDGVIFISISDIEYANLKVMCDSQELFGEGSYVTTLHVEMSATQGMKVRAAQNGTIVKNAEYILIYAKGGRKQIARNLLYDYRPDYDDHYSIYLRDGQRKSVREMFRAAYPDVRWRKMTDLYYQSPEFRRFVADNVDYIYADDKITGFDDVELAEGEIRKVERDGKTFYIYHNGSRLRQLLPLKSSFGPCDDFDRSHGLRKIRGDWWKDFYKDMGNVSKEGDVVFENGKKPVRLIYQLLKMASRRDSTVLDFFAGSGTTLHALMQLNDDDGGRRQCILCTNDENGICRDITYTRARNSIKGKGGPRGSLAANSLLFFRTELTDRRHSPAAMRSLAALATDMLRIRENTFDEQREFCGLRTNPLLIRCFGDGTRLTAVIYREEIIPKIAAAIAARRPDYPITLYVFSPGENPWREQFGSVAGYVRLIAVPAVIYNCYERVLPARNETNDNQA